jgi:hypothetical protein
MSALGSCKTATQRIAAKAAVQMADLLVSNLTDVEELVIGTPSELGRECTVIGVIKAYVRVGNDYRDHLPLPISIAYRVLDHLVSNTVPDNDGQRRRADEEFESALINLLQDMETKRWAQQRPLRISGIYTKSDATKVHLVMTWYADNTVRITR